MKQEFENIRTTVKCNEIDNLTLPLNMTLLPASALKCFLTTIIYQCFLDILEPNIQVHLKTKREFCVEMLCLQEVILLIRKRQQKPAFSQFDYHIDR